MLSEKDKDEIRERLSKLEQKERSFSEKKRKEQPAEHRGQGPMRYAQLGFEFIGGFLLFFFIGRYLDQKYNGNSLILVAFIFIGISFSAYRMIREAKNMEQ